MGTGLSWKQKAGRKEGEAQKSMGIIPTILGSSQLMEQCLPHYRGPETVVPPPFCIVLF